MYAAYSRAGCLLTVLPLLLFAGGCSQGPADDRPEPTTDDVYTTFYPTTYWAERIAGEQVNIVNPCPPDADPALWMPDDATVVKYQTAKLIIINGADFEEWVDKVTLPDGRLVDTSEPLEDELIKLEDAVTHSHGPGGEHTHTGTDGHTWLDPLNAKSQAAMIRATLHAAFPGHGETFDDNYAALAQDLDALDARLKAVSEQLGERGLVGNHPAWNYLARRYDWHLDTVHLDPEAPLTDEQIDELKHLVEDHDAEIMLWESEPLPETVTRLAELGLKSVVYAPAESLSPAQAAAGEDFLTMMNANVDRLEAALASDEG